MSARSTSLRRWLAVAVVAMTVAGACSDDDDSSSDDVVEVTTTVAPDAAADTTTTTAPSPPTTTTVAPEPSVESATLEGPITVGEVSPAADPRPVDFDAIGYVQEEFFASGTATAYEPVGELPTDGIWEVEATTIATYRTRFLVRRPADPAEFSGTVVVEWFNVSAVEAAPDWAYTSRAIVDSGAAWVGVSVQALGVNGGASLIDIDSEDQAASNSGGIRGNNPERYGTLEHPGDAYSFDIWSQVGAALRSPGNAAVFGDGAASVIIAMGESQSAGFLTSYVNAFHPRDGVFDGYFIHSRGSGAVSIDGVPRRGGTGGVQFRTDLDVPVMAFQTETDVGPLLSYAEARQPDTDLLRVWEVAGTAHADAYLIGGQTFAACPGGINNGPQHYVITAALEAFIEWVNGGPPPPEGTPIETDAPDSTTIVSYELGLALGGIRTPSVDVPVAALSGDAIGDGEVLCRLFGSAVPFDAATLAELYPDQQSYLDAFDASLDEAIGAGFVREADREMYAAEARAVEL